MNIKTYNKKGQETGETRLPKGIFDVKMNSDLLGQVVISQMANRRQGTVKTKDRSEVRGGGKKPWRQKGTGRARHGSIRSPLWRGGGVTFGPRPEKQLKKIISKKMRKKALRIVLSAKARENLIFLIEDLKLEKAKTKLVSEILKKLLPQKSSAIIVLPAGDEKIFKGARNIEGIKVIPARELNALDLLSYKYVVLEKPAIKVIANLLTEKNI